MRFLLDLLIVFIFLVVVFIGIVFKLGFLMIAKILGIAIFTFWGLCFAAGIAFIIWLARLLVSVERDMKKAPRL